MFLTLGLEGTDSPLDGPDTSTEVGNCFGGVGAFFDLEPFLGHFDGRGSHGEDEEANEGKDVVAVNVRAAGEGEGGEPDLFCARSVDGLTGVNGEGVGIIVVPVFEEGGLGGVADKNGSHDEHTGGDGEGDQVASRFFEPVTESLGAREGVEEDLDGGGDSLDDEHNVSLDESPHELEHGESESYRDNEIGGGEPGRDGAENSKSSGAETTENVIEGGSNAGDDGVTTFEENAPGGVVEEAIDDCRWGGDDAGGSDQIDDEVDQKVHKIDHETDDGVAKSDQEESDKQVGEGALDGDDGLSIDLGAEHDHDADDDKHDNIETIGEVAEGLPQGKEGFHGGVAGALSVCSLDGGDADIIQEVGDIFATTRLVVVEVGNEAA